MTALALVLASLSGCASVRWVDERTEGDLTGTAGRELGIVRVLGGPERGESASADDRGGDLPVAGTLLEILILFGSF